MTLHHMKLAIGKQDLADFLGVQAENMLVSNVHLNSHNQEIEFTVTFSPDVTSLKGEFSTSVVLEGTGDLRRQRLLK